MRFEDLSPEDQRLVKTDFGSLEKQAAAQLEQARVMYETGFHKLATEIADQLDAEAAASEKQASEEYLDSESEKVAAELGAFIERGQFDGLRKLGSDRHGNEWHYLLPFVEEKVASAGAGAALKAFGKKLKDHAGSAADYGKKMKDHAGSAADKAVGYHKGMAANARQAVTGKAVSRSGSEMRKGLSDYAVSPLSAKERAMEGGKALAKASPYLAAGAGLAAAAKSKKKED